MTGIPTGFSPMLADAAKSLELLKFPLIASPKLDGVRAHKFNSVFSRKLKLIPNEFVQRELANPALFGFDGELMVGSPTDPAVYRSTMSGVMARSGEPDFTFHVFDLIGHTGGFKERYAELRRRKAAYARGLKGCRVQMVEHREIATLDELLAFERECLERGFEGVMVRSFHGPYKCGRSTVKEGYLLKVKQFEDSECEVLGYDELQHNMNEATVNELGRTKRSTHKAGKVAAGTLGSLHVRDLKSGVEFDLGGGFTAAQREELWGSRAALVGTIHKYKFFPGGSKEKPRFPTWLGPRDKIDL